MRLRALSTRAAIVIAAALLLALPAHADALDDAKNAGHVGEQVDGYLGLVPGAPGSANALVTQINAGRANKYAEIAAANGTTATAVGAVAGEKLVARATAGQWVRDASGNWTQK